jgi:ABC-type multidrug transport system ATPase subunit
MSLIESTMERSHPRTGTRGGAGPDGAEVVIDVSGLRMSYDGFKAVRGIDLRVSRGEIFTFLGPNGAGKTTTVEILEGRRKRTAGDVHVLAWQDDLPDDALHG